MLSITAVALTIISCFAVVSSSYYDENGVINEWKGKYYVNGQYNMEKVNEDCRAAIIFWENSAACSADRSGIIGCSKRNDESGGLIQDGVFEKKCPAKHSCGDCKYVGMEAQCKCIVDPKHVPQFPAHGSITWSGMMDWSVEMSRNGELPLLGKLQSTDSGMYLFDRTDWENVWSTPRKTRSITIIIPRLDGRFTQFNSNGDGSCSVTVTYDDRRKDLTYLWTYMTGDDKKNYKLRSDDVTNEIWGAEHNYSAGCRMGCYYDRLRWKMTVEMTDAQKRVGLPKSFLKYRNSADWIWEKNVNFVYKSAEEYTLFRFEDYCHNTKELSKILMKKNSESK